MASSWDHNPGGTWTTLSSFVYDHLWATVLVLLILVGTTTRLITGIQSDFEVRKRDPGPRSPPVLPYWLPWLGHTAQFRIGSLNWLRRVFHHHRSGIVSLVILGRRHSVIVSPSLTEEVLSRANAPVHTETMVMYRLKHFFGDRGATKKTIEGPGGDAYRKEYHRTLQTLNHEAFVSIATKRITNVVEQRVWNLISGNQSWIDQEPWERSARVDVISATTTAGEDFVAEADLHLLLRDWIGQIATNTLFGRAFLEVNPNVLDDMWKLDSKMNHFLLGLPSFLVPGLLPAYFARERLIAAAAEHHEAMCRVLDGKDPGSKYDDLSDVPQIVWDRVKLHKNVGASSRAMVVGNTSVLWAMNVNSNQLVFWMIFYVYSDPKLLAAIRGELGSCIQIRKSDPTGFAISTAPELKIDVHAVMNQAPHLKGAFYEVMRLEVAQSIYREINEDFTVAESKEDARLLGKSQPEIYLLKKGDLLFIPTMIHQEDPAYFPDPQMFDPQRFWTIDQDGAEKVPGKKATVTLKTLRSFGGGNSMCKGRNFAEREVMVFAAAIIMTWEIEPVDKTAVSADGRWKHPGHTFAMGAAKPNRDVRVRMRRRKW